MILVDHMGRIGSQGKKTTFLGNQFFVVFGFIFIAKRKTFGKQDTAENQLSISSKLKHTLILACIICL